MKAATPEVDDAGHTHGHSHADGPGEAHGHGHGHGHADSDGHGRGHSDRHEHGHGHGDVRPGAPEAPADVLAYLDGLPLPRRLLDDRLATLRAGDTACVLPKPDTREARQLARWIAQVIITEQLCINELHHQGKPAPDPSSPVQPAVGAPDPTSPVQPAVDAAVSTSQGVGAVGWALGVSGAVAVGSIAAAALAGSGAVRRVAELVSRDVVIPAEQLAYAADVLGEEVPLDPAVPVERWHAELVDSARLEAFTRWLNAARFERVQLVHGLEHPGDSNQPDNLHRH